MVWSWLPPKLSLAGVPENEALNLLYQIFKKDFHQGSVTFQDRLLTWNTQKYQNYEKGFLHVVTKQDPLEEEDCRIVDISRSEKLPWCKPGIINQDRPGLKVWEYQEKPRVFRYYIWFESLDYLIVLEKRTQKGNFCAHLITAHHIDGASRRRNLEKKFKDRQK